MQVNKLADNWLFQQYSKYTVRQWLTQLHYFYFIRAWGGLANDGDSFRAGFTYTGREDLLHKLGQLGIYLNTIPADFPRPVAGQAYPKAEYDKFKNEIRKYSDLEQPGHRSIFGHKAFVWVEDHAITITISGTKDNDAYKVSEADLAACMALEEKFNQLQWQAFVERSIEENACCISKAKYPELYGNRDQQPEQPWWQRLFKTGNK